MIINAIVVLYNPDENVIDNINTYLSYVDKVIIVDNSSISSQFLKNLLLHQNIEYYFLGKNKGLAFALNYGCKVAKQNGASHILLMDQDSFFDSGALKKMIAFCNSASSEIGVVSPNVRSLYHDNKNGEEKEAYIQYSLNKNTLVNWSMTSGSIIRTDLYDKCFGFDDELFIAHIDIDFCYRVFLLGYKTIIIGDAILNQHFGNSVPKKILWKVVHPSFAAPIRSYYIFRNQKYLELKYDSRFKRFCGISLWKFVIKTILFEKNKIFRLKLMKIGLEDGKKGKMGEYKNEKF